MNDHYRPPSLGLRVVLSEFVIIINGDCFQMKICRHVVQKRGIYNVIKHSATKALLCRRQNHDCNFGIVLYDRCADVADVFEDIALKYG